MSNICKGICSRKKANGSSNKLRYALGQKFCSICRVYFDTDKLRCECCGTKLRTKPRTPKSKKIYALLKGGNDE